jgi:hypothetical protein
MIVPRPPADFEPDLVLLMHGDPNDAVTRALFSGRAQLGWPLVAVSAQEMLDGIELGDAWTVAGRRVDPRRTAVINRLPLADRLELDQATVADTMARQALWSRLREELGRFRYVSSLPTATSIMGCYGSLLDQWEDLPRLVPGLRVPDHSAPTLSRALHGTVFAVNRWTPYSLGKPLDEALADGLPAAVRLDYVPARGILGPSRAGWRYDVLSESAADDDGGPAAGDDGRGPCARRRLADPHPRARLLSRPGRADPLQQLSRAGAERRARPLSGTRQAGLAQ